MAALLSIMNSSSRRLETLRAALVNPSSNRALEIDDLLMIALPFASSSILIDKGLGLHNGHLQNAFSQSRPVGSMSDNMLSLIPEIELRRKTVHFTEAVVARAPRVVETAAIELAQWAQPPQSF